MPQRFIRRSRRDKFVRIPDRRNTPTYTVVAVDENKDGETKEKDNTKKKSNKDMTDNLDKIKDALGIDAKTPKKKVKVEKKDRGLFERTEESTILITEDNKMVLND
jgi:hypothetical protein